MKLVKAVKAVPTKRSKEAPKVKSKFNSLRAGGIYYFKYLKYKRDESPLALILYADDLVVHALNFHYLTPELNDELIEMIAQIASKEIKFKGMFKFYHDIMKYSYPSIIKNSYRTYKSIYLKNAIKISEGYEMTKSFLKNLKGIKVKQETAIIKEKIKDDLINPAKIEKATKQQLDISTQAIFDHVDEYMKEIQNIIGDAKLDLKKYTALRRIKK